MTDSNIISPVDLFDNFNTCFDSDSDDNEVEISQEQEASKRQAFLQLCKDYKPKGGQSGWFNSQTNHDIIDKLCHNKNGPSELKHSMEYYYMKRDFHTVCQIGHLFLDNKQNSKVNNVKEITEIIIRSHLRLNEKEQALQLVNYWEISNDPGHLFLKAQVLSLSGKIHESLSLFKKYLNNRANDYQAWKEIGLAIERYIIPSLRTSESVIIKDLPSEIINSNLVTQCYELSFCIMNKSQWNIEESPFMESRYNQEASLLKHLIKRSQILPQFDLELETSLQEWLNYYILSKEELIFSSGLKMEGSQTQEISVLAL